MTFLRYGYTIETAPAQDITHRSQIFFSVNRPIDKQRCVVYPARANFLKVNRHFSWEGTRYWISMVNRQTDKVTYRSFLPELKKEKYTSWAELMMILNPFIAWENEMYPSRLAFKKLQTILTVTTWSANIAK